MKINIFFIGCLGFILSSCNAKINKKQKEQLSKMEQRSDSIADYFNSVDSNKISKMTASYFKKKDFIQNGIQDTLEAKTIFFIDKFFFLRKQMSFLKKEYSPLKKEANTMNSQIKDLKTDVNNRLVDEKRFEKYYKLESNNLDQLSAAAQQFDKVYTDAITNTEKISPGIDSLLAIYNYK